MKQMIKTLLYPIEEKSWTQNTTTKKKEKKPLDFSIKPHRREVSSNESTSHSLGDINTTLQYTTLSAYPAPPVPLPQHCRFNTVKDFFVSWYSTLLIPIHSFQFFIWRCIQEKKESSEIQRAIKKKFVYSRMKKDNPSKSWYLNKSGLNELQKGINQEKSDD